MLSAQVTCLQGTANISISRLLFSPFSKLAIQEVFGGFLAARSFEGTDKPQMDENIDIVFLLQYTISTLSGRLFEPPMSSPVQLEPVGLCIQLSEIMRTFCFFKRSEKNSVSVSLCWNTLRSKLTWPISITIFVRHHHFNHHYTHLKRRHWFPKNQRQFVWRSTSTWSTWGSTPTARLMRSCRLLYKKRPVNDHEKEHTDIYSIELFGQMQLTEGSERQAFAVVRSETVVACNIIIGFIILSSSSFSSL